MAKNVELKDDNNEIMYPLTKITNVFDTNNQSLDTIISNINSTKVNVSDNIISAYATCDTSASTSAKVVTIADTNWQLKVGCIIGVKFSVNNSASNVTLNVNNTGAKQIYYGSSVYTSSGLVQCGWANGIVYYMYNGTYWCWLSFSQENNDNHYTTMYCSTSSGTAAKSASCTNYNLLAKSYGIITLTNANTYAGALTLNVNSKGAKPIYINDVISSSTNYSLPAGQYFIYYDGTNYYFRTDGVLPANAQRLGNSSTASSGLKYDKIYHRIAYANIKTQSSYQDFSALIYIAKEWNSNAFGIARLNLRINDSNSVSAASIQWLINNSFSTSDLYFGLRSTFGSTYLDIFTRCNGTYYGVIVSCLNSNDRRSGSTNSPGFIFVKNSSQSDSTSEVDTECWITINSNTATSYDTTVYKGSNNVIKSGSLIKKNSVLRGTTYSADTTITSDIVPLTNDILKAGCKFISGSILNGTYTDAGYGLHGQDYTNVTASSLVGQTMYSNYTYSCRNGGAITAGSAITAGNIVVADSNGKYKHLKLGTAFDISYPILYAGSNISANATGNNNFRSLNMTITTTQSISLTVGKAVYIKGTLNGNTFTPISTTPLTQTIPTSKDNYQYIYLGQAFASNQINMSETHQIYMYVGGKFQLYTTRRIDYVEDTTGGSSPDPFADYYNKSQVNSLLNERVNIGMTNSVPSLSTSSVTISGKAGVKTTGVHYVVESWKSNDGLCWYRIYNDGYKECSAITTTSSGGIIEYTLPLPSGFSSTNYTCVTTLSVQDTGNKAYAQAWAISSTKVKIAAPVNSGDTYYNYKISINCCGY